MHIHCTFISDGSQLVHVKLGGAWLLEQMVSEDKIYTGTTVHTQCSYS